MREPGVKPAPSAAAGLANVRIVLVRPRGGANVGAAARAMKNMGVGDLVMVAPALRRLAVAEALAVHARDVVRAARVTATIGEAVADCHLVVGTTCRGGPYRAAVEDPGELAPVVVAHAARGPVAILFGPEDHGLSNDDLRHCQRLLTIHTSAAYASLNLAQAVLLVCYELRRAARPELARPRWLPEPAPAAAVERMFTQLQSALLRVGFLNRQNPDHIMFALRQLFGRTTLADHEVRILLGLARQIEWYARTKGVAGGQVPVAGQTAAPDPDRPLAAGHRPRSSAHG
jgi:TrmH family RNA methyltransferase